MQRVHRRLNHKVRDTCNVNYSKMKLCNLRAAGTTNAIGGVEYVLAQLHLSSVNIRHVGLYHFAPLIVLIY